MPKVLAVLSGGDWYDANVDHIIMTTDISVRTLLGLYLDERGYHADFPGWLVKNGYARQPTDNELEVLQLG